MIKEAIDKAIQGLSKIDQIVLDLPGMSSPKNRHLMNNLVAMTDNAKYLEIGLWQGSTFISALYKNKYNLAVGIDNFSEYTHAQSRAFLVKNLEKCLPESDYKFIEADYKEVDYSQFPKFNIYFYDGWHSEEDQYNALVLLLPYLEDEFIFIVDDWNMGQVQVGTRNAIKDLKLKILESYELEADFNGDTEKWWNGLFICRLKK